ncbi:MAG: hypothetical protein ABGY42_15690 [bacterium]
MKIIIVALLFIMEGGAVRAFAQTVAIDPETGEFIASRPAPEAAAPTSLAAPDEPENLKILDSPVPGGGSFVDLQGRFRQAIRLESGGKPSCKREDESKSRTAE